MANKVLWANESASQVMTTELNSLANSAFAVDGADYANATNKFRFATFQLDIASFASAPTAGTYLELHAFYKLDGTLYADGNDGDADADSIPSSATLVGIFPVSSTNATRQIVSIKNIQLVPKDVRFCVKNLCGQALAASGNVLTIFPYNEEVQ